MRILGIESSCDETAAAVVEDGRTVLSSVIKTQTDIHQLTKGVVPENAARAHIPAMLPVIEESLRQAKTDWSDIDAIAVATSPGLISSLLVGVSAARTLAILKNKPLIPVHHVAGHLYSPYLNSAEEFIFPRLIITLSGGHNFFFLMRDHFKFEKIGESIDDAAGEAFDKAARMLGLDYPGGPHIEKRALQGDVNRFQLPRPMINSDDFNMSFSGLKTALYYKLHTHTKDGYQLTEQDIADYSAAVQAAIFDVVIAKINAILQSHPEIAELHLVGGVSANQVLRKRLNELGDEHSLPVYMPSTLTFCTDNAAMIASCAYFDATFGDVSKRPTGVVATQSVESFYS